MANLTLHPTSLAAAAFIPFLSLVLTLVPRLRTQWMCLPLYPPSPSLSLARRLSRG